MHVGGLSERRARGQRVKSSVFLAAVFVILSFWFTLWKPTLYIHVIMMSYCSFYRSPREESKCCQSCFNGIFYGLSSFASTNCCCAISTLQKKWLASFSNDDPTAAKTSVVLKFWRFWRNVFAIISTLLKCQMHVTFPGIEILGDRIQVYYRRRKKNLSWCVLSPWGNVRPRPHDFGYFWERRFFLRFPKNTHLRVAYSNRFRPSIRKR